MSESHWYIVIEGTNIRACFDDKNKNPKVFDTREIAQSEINRVSRNLKSSVKRVPISVTEYDEKYSGFVEKSGEIKMVEANV